MGGDKSTVEADAKSRVRRRIGESLLREGYIEPEHAELALAHQRKYGGKMAEILIHLGFLDPASLGKFLATRPGMPSIDLANYTTSPETCEVVPREFAVEHQLFPIDKMGKLLTVGMAFPLDTDTINQLQEITGLSVKAVLCGKSAIRSAIRKHYADPDADGESGDDESHAGAITLEAIAPVLVKIESLPTLPRTLEDVREAMEDPDVTGARIADIIELDPPITVRLLKLANSASYSFNNRVKDVHRATTLLGLQETQVLVLSSAVLNLVEESTTFDYNAYWEDAMFAATAARVIGQRVDSNRMTSVFTAGLLHDIGRFALNEAVPARYGKVPPGTRGDELIEAEEDCLGIAHPEAGYFLAMRWALPVEIAEAIRFHHRPGMATQSLQTVAITALAAFMTEARRRSDVDALFFRRCRKALDMLDLDAETAVGLFDKTVKRLKRLDT